MKALTFASLARAGAEGVAVETFFTAVAEEALGVIDALQALPGLPVAVADGVQIDVAAAHAFVAAAHGSVLTQRVPKVAVVTELAAFTCRHVSHRQLYLVLLTV